MEIEFKKNERLRHFVIDLDLDAALCHGEIIDDFVKRGVVPYETVSQQAHANQSRHLWFKVDFVLPETLAAEYERRLTAKRLPVPEAVEASEEDTAPAVTRPTDIDNITHVIKRVQMSDGVDRDLDWDIAEALGGNVRRVSRLGLSGRTPGSNRVFWPGKVDNNKGSAIPAYTKDRTKALAKLKAALARATTDAGAESAKSETP